MDMILAVDPRPGGEHVAAAGHVEDIACVVSESLQLVDAVVRKRRHDGMRPPITIVIARLRARVAHRLARVYQDGASLAVRHAEIICRRNTGNTGADNGYVC
jgi:hypothetical protein